jgi:hypothetical protein
MELKTVHSGEKAMVSAQFPACLVLRLAELARANECSLSAELRRAAAEGR